MDNLIREDTFLTVQGTEIPRLGYGTWQVIRSRRAVMLNASQWSRR